MSRFLLPGLVLGIGLTTVEAQSPKSYRLPAVDLKPQVIWGSVCELADGTGLAFGGQDQKADDGNPHTRIKVNGKWQAIHEELRQQNSLKDLLEDFLLLCRNQKTATARARAVWFRGLPPHLEKGQVKQHVGPAQAGVASDLALSIGKLEARSPKLAPYQAGQARHAIQYLGKWHFQAKNIVKSLEKGLSAELVKQMHQLQVALEIAAEMLDAEPPPRALSPIAYDERTKLFVIFGGDHLDYLMNDIWVFDPAKKKWEQRHPKTAPPPRANHTLKATGDGKIVLSGGYTYTSNTDYVGGQYRDHNDGDWTYDIAANSWTGTGKAVEPNQRIYRTGPFHPDFYLQGAKPDARETADRLAKLPVNTWVSMKPPYLPRLNRDWGTAVLDPDRDLILRWSGGHSAHGGTDVLHYHIASNRWELTFPVEFPLGQTYSNTSYPEGFNFNLRPWVTGHTYQNYGYDPVLKKMLFTGRDDGQCYVWDPDKGDWIGRFPKPPGMIYNSCFYTLTLTPTPQGLVCWTQAGRLFRFETTTAAKGKFGEWVELKLQGKLPGAVVDNSTLWHDSKRDRLCFVTKGYGDKFRFDGEIHTVDLKSLAVGKLSPQGMEAAASVPYLCQLRYDAGNDLVLVGGLLPPDSTGFRRTPAYDPAGNRWVSLKITGDDPSGKTGRNVSLGLMHDARRGLFWAVDTNSNVYVLRLDPKTADVQPLK